MGSLLSTKALGCLLGIDAALIGDFAWTRLVVVVNPTGHCATRRAVFR
ncbi:hypothetical protein [Spirosoma sp. KUDC1026]|nr:hypothetical protein [Spirosoma sp. KUDC1026]QKZ15910.1 hypothetical protein HU175_24645 [Spirosoma sp. KUDC1026]